LLDEVGVERVEVPGQEVAEWVFAWEALVGGDAVFL
jgi:hypothetical protein